MKRNLIAMSGWLALALVVLGGAVWTHAQVTLPDGAFVRTGDGSVWVVSNGARIAIRTAPDSSNVISGLRDGGSATTAGELAAAMAALAAPPPPPPGPANPAETLIGQTGHACSYGVPIDITVTRVEWIKTVLGTDAPGNAMWIVAFIDVTNQGLKDESLYGMASAQVRDERGRVFEWRAYPPDPVDFGRAYMVKGSYEKFSPGITEQSVAAFQVPSDVRSLTLEGKSIGCN